MLQLSGAFLNQPVLSLRAGRQIASVSELIINPDNLKVEGLYCRDSLDNKLLVLLPIDIRDILAQGVVVNDHEVLAQAEELVRLKNVIELDFKLIDKPVVSVSQQKIGKVSDFAVDTSSMYVQKIYVTQPLLKSFNTGSLSVDRNQIVEITNKKIVIQDLLQPLKTPAPAPTPQIVS